MEKNGSEQKYETKATRSAIDLVIREENIGEHPYPEVYDCGLGYRSVKIVLPKGYELGNVCRKDGEEYLILQKKE